MKAQLLRPSAWHFKEESRGDTSACFLSVESIESKGAYETGLSIHLLRSIPKAKGVSPAAFARGYLEKLATVDQIIRQAESIQGPFKAFRAEHLSRGKGLPDLHLVTLLIANDSTGSVFLTVFESPDSSWPTYWPLAEPILKRLFLDDEV